MLCSEKKLLKLTHSYAKRLILCDELLTDHIDDWVHITFNRVLKEYKTEWNKNPLTSIYPKSIFSFAAKNDKVHVHGLVYARSIEKLKAVVGKNNRVTKAKFVNYKHKSYWRRNSIGTGVFYLLLQHLRHGAEDPPKIRCGQDLEKFKDAIYPVPVEIKIPENLTAAFEYVNL